LPFGIQGKRGQVNGFQHLLKFILGAFVFYFGLLALGNILQGAYYFA
jgi:hypothetical protein